ncbi:MAG: glyoxalase superfamily protein [Alphaproteobacteria bacterium]|nr:glyoxalase superfamily protein [Alphaproteobacteria bacterium]
MTYSSDLPELSTLKDQARRLRAALEAEGDFITHSHALELIARQRGYRDWNTLHAAAGNRPRDPFTVGARVRGRYLGQAFAGELLAVRRLSDGKAYAVTVDFDEPVDVVRFEGFSNLRKRVNATVRLNGESVERTSDGRAHLELHTV